MSIKGILIPIGGNEDKGNGKNERHTLEYIEEGILSRVVKESGGIEATIVVIPTASSIPVEVSETYQKAFEKLECTNVHVMDIRSREDAENPEFLELMKRANCVMFSGGDQSKIVKYIGDTSLDKIIKEKYKNEKFVIAGTSAGAMCMSEEMITGGGIQEAFTKGATSMGKGMGYIHNFIIDSHFIRRGRFGRLAEAVARFPNRVGIGLAEDTGLVIKKGNKCEVIGSGMVILFDPRRLIHNNQAVVKEGSPMSITNLKIHILANGDLLNIKKRKVKFSPMHLKLTDAETV
ncbi:cyanophycinase [Aequorivita viscosa]|uniref:Cyanophycinase n=1 Tax=Aequorivita viscosa TaxID=797419 RepID=A0A1M6KPW4_9FLAO|nr:cyanophycinase [Aequorivita viscosa]SDX03022.1 cyanophycinase [Aequorivita viscosa]SHJ60987.1 cyanophycinase [Aequorivita viscosa]